MKNRFFILPFRFSEAALHDDLHTCVQAHWQQHFNTSDYSGEWTSIALRSASGAETDIYAHPESDYKDTSLLGRCPYFREIMDGFQCEKEAVRLLSLAPGSTIHTHTDPYTGYEYGMFRIHIPIQTDAQVDFCVDGERLDMKQGECWYANFHLPHSVAHHGSQPRVHLILDCRRNAWSDALFREAGYDFEEEKRILDYDRATKQNMIDALERMDTETSRQMVAKLRQELQGYA